MTAIPALLHRLLPGTLACVTTAVLSLTTSTASAFPIAAAGTEGDTIIVTGTGDVIATFEGHSAAYSNDLMLNGAFIFNNHATPIGTTADLGSFAVGTELVFELFVHNTGDAFYSGPASRNADGHTHARVDDTTIAGKTLVSFEDLYGGPYDYNDTSFSFTNTVAVAAVPEPSTLALMLAGFAVVAWSVGRARKVDRVERCSVRL